MPLFSRIARSIQGRVSNNPDGALAKYLWLWQSMGKRPGRSLIPRPIRFFFVVSLDVLSLVGWYVCTGMLRVVRSARSKEAIMSFARTNVVAGLIIMVGMAIGGGLTLRFLPSSPSGDVPPQPVVVVDGVPPRSPVVPLRPTWVRRVDVNDYEAIVVLNEALFYINGARIETSVLRSLDPDDVESVEVWLGDEAVALYGQEASRGAVLISLGPRPRSGA